ncbi:MAG: ribosomal RNA small subunit methyltransferase A [Spirochaetales bacterium]|nr:ribosomal RNA small subunit methyltransferase A [Spirochaetales bacterium]
MNYDSPNDIKMVLSRLNIGLKKRWGQNFMISRGAREKIVDLLAVRQDEKIWEIGPGLGALTELLLDRSTCITVFEIDAGLIRFLLEEFGDREESGFYLVRGDVVKTWKAEWTRSGMPARVTGNLPYASSSLILAGFVEEGFFPEKMVFTVQKELAQRMTAKPGEDNYSSFSVFCQWAFNCVVRSDLKPGSFFPVPQVTSSIIELQSCSREEKPLDEKFFLKLVRASFAMRRKTLRNNLFSSPLLKKLKKSFIHDCLVRMGLKETVRAEELCIDDFIHLADLLSGSA